MSTAEATSSHEDLIEKIKSLAPWHLNIQINEALNTGMVIEESGEITFRDKEKNSGISLLQLRDYFLATMDKIYPEGVEGKTFLDCACNSGGYSFWMSERGIKSGFGFDVRDHWINQANFVKENRTIAPTDCLQFAVTDLYDLPNRNLQPFDITMFKGIFYHLPDPITGLKIAADLTNEIMIFNTSTAWDEKDGYLKCGMESRELLMSGVHGLRWYPTGPGVLAMILKWMGFVETQLIFHNQMDDVPELGRCEIIAAKKPGMLSKLPGELI